MNSSGTYKVSDQKCTTCSYWTGEREIQLVAYKPTYIKAAAGNFKCLTQGQRTARAVDRCPSWRLWEKIG